MICQICSYHHYDNCQHFDILTNIIKEKAHTHSIILSPTGMVGYSQAKGLGDEHLGYINVHIYEWIWGWWFLHIPRTGAHTHAKIDLYPILTSFPKRKWMKTSSHQSFYISISINKYACHFYIHIHVCTSYTYIYICMYLCKVIKVTRRKACMHFILNFTVSLSSSKLSHDFEMKKVTCCELIILPSS